MLSIRRRLASFALAIVSVGLLVFHSKDDGASGRSLASIQKITEGLTGLVRPTPIVPEHQDWVVAKSLFPLPASTAPQEAEWEIERREALAQVLYCSRRSCPRKYRSAVLCAAGRFRWALDGTFERPSAFANGEAILAKSFMWALKSLGYPFIYIDESHKRSRKDAVQLTAKIYRLFPDSVKLVIYDYLGEPDCLADADCFYNVDTNPSGMPLWKMFIWDAMGGFAPYELPYRGPWHLSGIPVPPATFLGITLEDDCKQLPFVPQTKRSHQAYVLGKSQRYFNATRTAWTADDFAALKKETGLSLISGVKVDGREDKTELPSAIDNMGVSTRTEFLERISMSKVMIGIGGPTESPSPFEALCMGASFINPGRPRFNASWYQFEQGEDQRGWSAQHSLLLQFGEPYVYNILRGNRTQLISAVQRSLARPLTSPFLPPMLTNAGVLARVIEVMETDWQRRHIVEDAKYQAEQLVFSAQV
ncbi:glycosyltransferase family 18 protein [Mixia osmundae IAM 14324]|uniref:alpha-1,6-mannosyl-glycoprotein 6-beta-N-acetylglucosaminyltransferase n=1 Tax=Mixia osmundae (strain CBS 9802 / IAM 14324 / JCM 22182 / KY 12970) TaxID=764103 RepID=G7DWC6_MIXOS|nr:glycosyltransferase family 18 protein [Mixia osmundae IAM 14324]KEI40934.1 glycosyltransferase family 18 protein [Mixia osmundae IAM 14324]GAA94886.1 hypothetical protein E5Q_01541 [Mixia osmundae IAM 14324]